MYHLLVSYDGWPQPTDSIDLSRVFEYTEDSLIKIFLSNNKFDIAKISRFPALFASEIGGVGEQIARVGYINHITTNGINLNLHYVFAPNIPPITNDNLKQLSSALDIQASEFTRTHWAVKDVDLFRVLYEQYLRSICSPKIFSIEEACIIENDLISIMMPFSNEFNNVYETIQQMARSLRLRCLTADDIWEYDAIIQDIVSLICRSRIVVCDCTGRNPNVFYETGIAHTLGKDVILITQNHEDIPFDLRHLRYLRYLNNNEGRDKLSSELAKRVATILGY